MADISDFLNPIASPNLAEDDPMRAWAQRVQTDPELRGLLATDPQGAMNRMKELGIPPPPQGFTAYTDGLSAENTVPPVPPYRTPRSGPGVIGGADAVAAPLPPPMVQTNRDGSIRGNVSDLDPSYTDPMGVRVGGAAEAPPGNPDFRITKPGATLGYIGGPNPPAPLPLLPKEVNPNPVPSGYVPSPMRDPRKAESAGAYLEPTQEEAAAEPSDKSTDVSAKKKSIDAFNQFAKGLQGVKAPQLPAPQKVSTPSAPQHAAMQAPNLNALLSLVGQPASPIVMTLGRLLATGKA